MAREQLELELRDLRESLLRMAALLECQISDAVDALRGRDRELAEKVRRADQEMDESYRGMREQCLIVIAMQQPVARDLRALMGVLYIAAELERMGDYAVRIARMTTTLCGLPNRPLWAEFGQISQLAIEQVHDILDALIEQDEPAARGIAARDDEIDRLYHRVFDDILAEMASSPLDSDEVLRSVTLMLVAHNLERIGDRVTNVAEDIVFLQSGQVVELG